MPTVRRLAAALAVALSTLALRASAETLPTDASLTTGEIENGLRYVVRRCSVPPGHATVWLHMHTGSLDETDRQRGIAHYLEHMAFNGSENFPPGSLVPYFESMGMTFGRDQNAFTNMEQTTFQLTLPSAASDTLGKGMTYFADVLFRLLLTPKEIDAERQIILEERRRGLSGRQRARDYVLEHSTPGSLYGQRETIGTEETIKGVTEKDFRDYYGRWYTASNATVIVAADADPAEVVKVIKGTFGAAPKRPRPTPQDLNVRAYDKSFAIVATDPEVNTEDVRIYRLKPSHPPTTTVEQVRDDLVLELGESALNRRLDDKVARGGTSYRSARVASGDDSHAIHTAEISGSAFPGKWKPALEELALELQRARSFGFTPRELDDARKQVISGAERAVETESTMAARAIVSRINAAVASGETILSSEQRLNLLRQALPTIKPEEVTRRFAAEYDPKAVAFIATLPSGPDVPSESALLDVGTKALAVPPTQEAEVAHATTLLKDLPKPGEVKESDEHATSHVWNGWLGNNARVHFRFMDYDKSQVTVSITLYGGEILETADTRGMTGAAQLAWSRPATQTLTSGDIREILTGKKVSVGGGGFGGGGRGGRGGGGFGGPGGAITLRISGSPADLETGFQLAYLLLTQPKIEAAAFAQHQTTAKQAYDDIRKNPSRLAQRLIMEATYPDDDARFKPATPAQIDHLTLAAAQAWLERLVKESPVEVAIVGDVSKERVLDLATRYIGSLPPRERVRTDVYAPLRTLARPTGPRVLEKSLETPTDQAFVFSAFYACDEGNLADVRALNMASRILSTRMTTEVREEAQLVYSIGASLRPGGTYLGFGVLSASATTAPAKVPALKEKLASMYAAFAKEGPSDAELDVARKQRGNDFEEQMKEPAFWLARLDQLTYRGENLDDVMSSPAAYRAITAKQVKDTFAKYYVKENAIVVTVMPQAVGGGKGGETEPGK